MSTSPAETEKLFLFLAGGDPEELLFDVRATKSTALLQYARQWLTMVAKEFMAELQSALVCGTRLRPARSAAGTLHPWPERSGPRGIGIHHAGAELEPAKGDSGVKR